MHSRRAMDVQLRPWLVQSLACKIHASLEHLRRLRVKIIVNGIPQHPNSMPLGQGCVVKLNLHVDDVRHARPRHRRHVLCRPNPATDRNPAGYPRHVHPERSCMEASGWDGATLARPTKNRSPPLRTEKRELRTATFHSTVWISPAPLTRWIHALRSPPPAPQEVPIFSKASAPANVLPERVPSWS